MNDNKIQSNWLGLNSYAEEDQDKFFGRDKEIDQLQNSIQDNPICTIYGPSGVGKTSLLLAGVFPHLRSKSYLPVYVRLNHDSHAKPYSMQIKESFLQAAQDASLTVKEVCRAISQSSPETLWEWFHRHEFLNLFNKKIIPLLLIDQFEEIFTLGLKKAETEEWLDELSDLCANNVPVNVINTVTDSKESFHFATSELFWRVVLCLREDFLPRLEEYSDKLPIFRKNRISVTPLTKSQALEVVVNAGKNIILNETVANAIVDYVIGNSNTVETPLLSLFCSRLDYLRQEKGFVGISLDLVEKNKNNVLINYYDESFGKISEYARDYLEKSLLNSNGYRTSLQIDDVINNGVLRKELEELISCRLLHVIIRDKVQWIEYSHDILAPIAQMGRERRRKEKEKEDLHNIQVENISLQKQYINFTTITTLLDNIVSNVDEFINQYIMNQQLWLDNATAQIKILLVMANTHANDFKILSTQRSRIIQKKYNDALKIAQEFHLPDYEILKILILYATYLENENFFIKSKTFAKKAVQISKKLNTSKGYDNTFLLDMIKSLIILGKNQHACKQYENAEQSYNKAICIFHAFPEALQLKNNSILIQTLNNLGRFQIDCIRYEEAEKTLTKAIEICRNNLQTDTNVFLKDLATSLTSLGILQYNCLQYNDAEKSFKESIQILRNLALKQPDIILRDLAISLNNFGILQCNSRHYDEAEISFKEAVMICRKLIPTLSDASLPTLAFSLNCLGILQCDCGRYDEAENSLKEAVQIRREISKAQPEVFLQDFAKSLLNLGTLQCDCRHYNAAEKSLTNAVEIYRKLSKTHPQAFMRDMAESLKSLGNFLYISNHHAEAEASFKESIDIYRQLAKLHPNAFLPYLAQVINRLGNLQRDCYHHNQAETSFKEALEIRRKLGKIHPDVFLPDLASSLNNLGNLQSDNNRYDEAETSYKEAIEIFRKLVKIYPDTYLPDLALSLSNLGVLQRDCNYYTDAEISYKEAIKIRRKLSEVQPDAFLPKLAMSLNNLGVLLSDCNRYEEAKESYKEAITIRRLFANKYPDAFLPDLADSLNNLGVLQRNSHFFTEAEISYKEAIDIRRKLAKVQPDVFLQDLIQTLENMKDLYQKIGDKSKVQEIKAEIADNREKINKL